METLRQVDLPGLNVLDRSLIDIVIQTVQAITEGGGVTTRIKTRCMLRAPVAWQLHGAVAHCEMGTFEWTCPLTCPSQVFIFPNITEANEFYRFAHLATTQDLYENYEI